jgi:hypothetical protein
VQQHVVAEDSQRAEEMMRAKQQKQDDGDVVMKESGDGEDQAGEETAAGVKWSRCTKRGHFAVACKARDLMCDL